LGRPAHKCQRELEWRWWDHGDRLETPDQLDTTVTTGRMGMPARLAHPARRAWSDAEGVRVPRDKLESMVKWAILAGLDREARTVWAGTRAPKARREMLGMWACRGQLTSPWAR